MAAFASKQFVFKQQLKQIIIINVGRSEDVGVRVDASVDANANANTNANSECGCEYVLIVALTWPLNMFVVLNSISVLASFNRC